MTPARPVDLSGVCFLYNGVDTIRQLYEGKPEMITLGEAWGVYDREFNGIVTIDGAEWVVGSGGKSGFRYRLQNNALGLIVLIGSRYKEIDQYGAHLKIECSPHFLEDRSAEAVQAYLDHLASLFLEGWQATSVAIHIAVDVQGWQPPKDIEERPSTHSRRRQTHTGCNKLEMIGGETIQRYGDRQSYLFGSSSGLQFSAYRKNLEAYKRDKLDWWESVWNECGKDLDQPYYLEGKPVWRLEWRYHHCVVQQVQREDSARFETYADVAGVLTNFLRYGLNLFRLDYSRIYIDPFWQLLV